MKKLTVIIPFLNEGEEVRNTVESMMKYGGERVEFILIDDASEDGYDYESVAVQYGGGFIHHEVRQGVAVSRDEGVRVCQTPYFLLLDAHMRFYDEKWIDRIVEELEKNDRQLLCCQTKVLRKKEERIFVDEKAGKAYGAIIEMKDKEKLCNVKWNLVENHPETKSEEIACVLGAAYAASKRYWEYLKGLKGLQYYGGDEAYISMKVWLEGGKCVLLKDVVIGHIYRKEFPYIVSGRYVFYNKLFMSELLLPVNIKNEVFRELQKIDSKAFSQAYKQLIDCREELKTLKSWYQRIFTCKFDLVFELNSID